MKTYIGILKDDTSCEEAIKVLNSLGIEICKYYENFRIISFKTEKFNYQLELNFFSSIEEETNFSALESI